MSWLKIVEKESPLIFSLPHSGVELTDEMRSNLSSNGINSLPNQDWHLNELYDFLLERDANIVSTSISRYVVDNNRSLERNLFGDFIKSVIYQKNTRGEEIYDRYPNSQEQEFRINNYYKPYHEALDKQIDRCVSKFGRAYLIDLHSFMGLINADVCLGDINGKSCSSSFLSRIELAFINKGFDTVKNEVFNGGYITHKYLDNRKVESMQIELRYTNYLSEEHYESKVIPEIEYNIFNNAKSKLETVFDEAFFSKPI